MIFIQNSNCILDNSKVDYYKSIKNLPLYCSCTNTSIETDHYFDLQFGISELSGMIQIMSYPTDDILYNKPHSSGIGRTWDGLFNIVANKINEYVDDSFIIYEIGSGNGKLLKKLFDKDVKFNNYYCYEPNPFKYLEELVKNNSKTNLIKKFFKNENIDNIEAKCIIIHTHLFEHIEDPNDFLNNISNLLSKNKSNIHIFALPNLKLQFEKKYSNVLSWEHKYFISEDYIDIMLKNNNQEVLEKIYYLDHSIIYITRYSNKINKSQKKFNYYKTNKLLLDEYFLYYEKYVDKVNKIIKSYNKDIYLFGAHLWSQNLISFGLNIKKIKNILDSDINKQNLRLYGTNLNVVSPEIIKDRECIVILNVSAYYEEIKPMLKKLSNKVQII